jgi:uncharacterized hydrophobic protein (TIGR00271 family)
MMNDWITSNRFNPAYLPEMEDKLFFGGSDAKRKLSNYAGLLTLATAIATYGVISGSVATVIGAMIVAPLMTPIMGATTGMVLGNGSKTWQSLKLVGLSVVYVIGLSIFLSFFISSIQIGFDSNPEILSRVSPDLLALFAALASGAAGAFAISRKEISDSIPGVAIAISLVPPLTVVGISLAKAQWLFALGAFILFLTNFLAIILAGGAVLWVSGISGRSLSTEQDAQRKRAFRTAIGAMIFIMLLLGANTYRTVNHDADTLYAWNVMNQTITGSSYQITGVSVGPARVSYTLQGQGDLPDINQLRLDLEKHMGQQVQVEISVIPAVRKYYPDQIPTVSFWNVIL